MESYGEIEEDDDDYLEESLPPSTRVKKVLKWNPDLRKFEIEDHHRDEMKDKHITDESQWEDF